MANPSLTRQFTLTNFVWRLRANGHLRGEKIGAVNYLKLSRIPADIRLYWNFTNNRDTAFSIDELVRGFKINERDEAGNAKTLDNVWLWSEGEIPIEPLNDVIEIEYNGAGELIEPLLGNKSGSIDKIEKVQVVSAIDKILQPIKVVSTTNTQGKTIENYYRINANVTRPTIKYAVLSVDYDKTPFPDRWSFFKLMRGDITGFYRYADDYNAIRNNYATLPQNANIMGSLGNNYIVAASNYYENEPIEQPVEFQATSKSLNLVDKNGQLSSGFEVLLSYDNLDTRVVYGKFELYKAYTVDKKKLISVGRGNVPINYNYRYFMFELRNISASFWANGAFEKITKLRILDKVKEVKPTCYGSHITAMPNPGEDIAIEPWETTYDEKLGLYIFKTAEKTTYIAPAQDVKSYISLIAEQSGGSADFNIKIIPLVKSSNADAALYMGGLGGISIPLKSGFELNFNNKKTGMDYAVIEIPAGDIYQVELQLINVREDADGTSSAEFSNES